LRELKILDTTLRDGEQAPGNEMAPETKLALFSAIDACGVDYIDVAFPTASQSDFEVAREIARMPHRARISLLARARPRDIDRVVEAFAGERGQVQLLLAGSEIHVTHKRRSTVDAILEETRRAVAYTKSCGIEDIALGYEDATRGSEAYLRRAIEAGVEAGGTTIVLADTVGAATPSEMATLVARVRGWVGDAATISVHCHNDMGLAVASTLASIKASADVVQTTFGGLGERAGNAALEEVATVLHYKSREYGAKTNLDLARVREVCDCVLASLGLVAWKHKPINGRYAFSTAAGVHASGLENDRNTYCYVEPELFGRKLETVLNRLSGRANLRVLLGECGIHPVDAVIERMYERFIGDPNPTRFNRSTDLIDLYNSAATPPTRAVTRGTSDILEPSET
jgi:2-isopropylmalate synthase